MKEINIHIDTLESVLRLLETHLAYVPSSTYTGEIPDISLFNHLKTTCAEQRYENENRMGELFRSVSTKVSLNKVQRYEKEDLKTLMTPESNLNELLYKERECAVCGSSNSEIVSLKLQEGESVGVCASCRGV